MNTDIPHFTIPIQLVEFVLRNNKVRCFSIYLFLKKNCDGTINETRLPYIEIAKELGIRDKRTVNKYITQLIDLNWIGYNAETKNYFIRGFNYLRSKLDFQKRKAVICEFSNLKELKPFLAASLVGYEIIRQKLIQRSLIKRFGGAAALRRQGALQLPPPFFLRCYFGLSNKRIGAILGCRKSQANRLKIESQKLGFLQVNKKFKFVKLLDKPDFRLKTYSPDGSKFRFRKSKSGDIKVYEQLIDEIIPELRFKVIKRL